MHHAFNKENFKTHHTLPFYKIHASHINFGLNHASLVNPLPISYTVVISGCTTVNTYHATKLMGNDQCLSHALFNHIQETLWMGRGDVEEWFWQKQQHGPPFKG